MSSEQAFEPNSVQSIAKYKEILQSHGISDPVAEILEKDPSLRGQGGGSDRRYVTIKFENPNLKPLHLFTKVIVAGNASHMKIIRGVKAFEKEAVFFMKYLPAAKELCQRKGLDDKSFMDIYPKCYYGDENMIVMENLVLQGYEIVGMEGPHDWDTATIVLESLAKHHALSHAMIMENGGPEKFLQCFDPFGHDGFAIPTLATQMEGVFQSLFKTNKTILELNTNISGAPRALEVLIKLESMKKSLSEVWTSTIKTEDVDVFQLLNHGDLWYANMMFLKDSTTGKLIHYKAIDFQMLRYSSPSCDLTNYLLTSVKTDVRQNRLTDLLQFYLACLKKFSTMLGYPIDQQKLNCEILMLHYRKRFHNGLLTSFMTQYGAMQKVTKNVDFTKTDLADWGNMMTKLVQEWINTNPEEATQLTKEIVSVLLEFEGEM